MSDLLEITPEELAHWQNQNIDYQLIDVRSQEEHELLAMGGELMPLPELSDHVAKIARDKKVVIHCRSGKRSTHSYKITSRTVWF